jgi:exonuclease VII large subunit
MSAAEVAMRDAQLEENIRNIQQAVKRLENDKSDRKAAELDELEQQCKDCDSILEMIRMEFRSLNQDDKAKYRLRVKDHKQNLKVLRNDIEWLKSNNNKSELLGGAATAESKMAGYDLETAGGLMDYGRNLQQQNLASLQRTVGVIGDTQQIGRETATKLSSQTEQIKKMYGDLLEINDMLDRSRKIIARMLRKTASSKAIWILAFCVVVGIALIIYFKVR